jgi:hypothetical protein
MSTCRRRTSPDGSQGQKREDTKHDKPEDRNETRKEKTAREKKTHRSSSNGERRELSLKVSHGDGILAEKLQRSEVGAVQLSWRTGSAAKKKRQIIRIERRGQRD